MMALLLTSLRKLIGLAAAAYFALALIAPKKAELIDFRQIQIPLTIRVEPFSLAYAALEDSALDSPSLQINSIELAAGGAAQVPTTLGEEDEVVFAPENPAVSGAAPTTASNLDVIEMESIEPPRELAALKLAKTDVNIAQLLPQQSLPQAISALKPETNPDVRPHQDTQKAASLVRGGAPGPTDLRHLTPESMGYEDYAQFLIQRELAVREQRSEARVDRRLPERGSGNNKIYVGKSTAPPPATPFETTRPSAAIMSVASFDSSVAPPSPSALVSGTFEFSDGLAYMPGQKLVIEHSVEGAASEPADVNIQQGKFNLLVSEKSGSLLAKLTDATGETLGLGEVPLGEANTYHIKMRPAEGVLGHVISAHSFGRTPIYLSNVYVTIDATSSEMLTTADGRFEDSNVLPGSNFLLRAQSVKPGFWPSLMSGSTDELMSVPVFPDSMIQALMREVGVQDLRKAQARGVIWGRVIKNGRPIAGAEVQIKGMAGLRPVYFPFGSLLIPDLQRTSTGPNGYFAFVYVEPGLQAVELVLPGSDRVVQEILVEPHFVSHANFNLKLEGPSFEVREVQNPSRFARAELAWNGSPRAFTFDPSAPERPKMVYWSGSGLMFLESDGSPGLWPTRQAPTQPSSVFQAASVRQDWLQDLAARANITIDPRNGIIVGTVDGADFSVHMQDNIFYSPINRIYFDRNGALVSHGRAGGGFIFFNTPPGARTIGLTTAQSTRYATKLVSTAPSVANFVQYKFQRN